MTIRDLRPGDVAAVMARDRFDSGEISFAHAVTVEHVTETQIVTSRGRYLRMDGSLHGYRAARGRLVVMTPEIQAYLDAKTATHEAKKREEAERQAADWADPRTPILRRLDTDPTNLPWAKCTLTELQAVATILDQAEAREEKPPVNPDETAQSATG